MSVPPFDLKNLRLTPHALSAMQRRDVEPEEVAEALVHPDCTEPVEKGRRRYVKGPLAVVVQEGAVPAVVTVLLRQSEQWTDGDMRGRFL